MDRAAVEAFARPRSTLRWLDATTTLADFALVTFDVDPGRLTAVLPASLSPEVRTLDDGRARGFVSAVSFRDVDFRFAFAPWILRSRYDVFESLELVAPDTEPHSVLLQRSTRLRRPAPAAARLSRATTKTPGPRGPGVADLRETEEA